ncbi:MAG: ATP-binding protein [Pseudomonadota bacterium]
MDRLIRGLGMACLLCWASLLWAGQAPPDDGTIQVLDTAHFLLSSGSTPPVEEGRPVRLPDIWMERRPDIARFAPATGWYRFDFATPVRSGVQAIYLPRLGLNAQVFLNGHAIGNGGPFTEPVGRNWNRPLLFVIPPASLAPVGKPNRLHVRLLSHPYTQAYLDPVWIGPETQLRSHYEKQLFWRVSLNQTATLAIASMGILMLTLWWQRRQEVAYAWFGLSSLIWAAQSANLYLRIAPLETADWEILVNASFQVFSALLLAALLRFSGAGGKPLRPWLWGSALVSPLVLSLVPSQWFMQTSTLLHGLTLVLAAAVLALLLRAAARWNNRDAALLVAAMGLVVLFAAHDLLKHGQSGLFVQDVHLLHYSAPLIFLLVGLVMTSRFVTVLNEFEDLNTDLEARVEAKQAELKHSYERMHALETERAIGEERERIYRDLHDDVGAKLLSLVYRAGSPENASLARSALQDLRDVVSIIQPENLTLEALGADWRAECERRLGDAGIVLDWEMTGEEGKAEEADAPSIPGELETLVLSQPQALNLSRILREAVSNLIKHAQSPRAEIRVGLKPEGLELSIRDFGVGCPQAAGRGNGRGLGNMAMRAERIGATLHRSTAESGGCLIQLHLPRAHIASST